jgi:prolipoprotein diacylglyceryltransferase
MTYFMMVISGVSTFLLLSLRKKKYDISWLTLVIILVVAGTVGYYGAAFATYLSDGVWPGIRFYGKVLFVTISLFFTSKIIKRDYAEILDYYAPVDILALGIMKVNCLRFGCCAGIEMHVTDSRSFIFPSQIAELLCAVIIFAVLIGLEHMGKYRHYRYAMYLVSYGLTRFVFDAFREDRGRVFRIFNLDISVAQIFCAIIVYIGIVGICCVRNEKDRDVKSPS